MDLGTSNWLKTDWQILAVRLFVNAPGKRTLRSVVESYTDKGLYKGEQKLATRTNAHFANYSFSIESGAKELGGTLKADSMRYSVTNMMKSSGQC